METESRDVREAISRTRHTGGTDAGGAAIGVLVFTGAAGSGFNPGNFVGYLMGLLLNFATAMVNGISNLFTTVLAGFGLGLSIMFASWGMALGAYGIWGPVMVVVSLGAAGIIFHLLLDVIGVEKGIAEVESEI